MLFSARASKCCVKVATQDSAIDVNFLSVVIHTSRREVAPESLPPVCRRFATSPVRHAAKRVETTSPRCSQSREHLRYSLRVLRIVTKIVSLIAVLVESEKAGSFSGCGAIYHEILHLKVRGLIRKVRPHPACCVVWPHHQLVYRRPIAAIWLKTNPATYGHPSGKAIGWFGAEGNTCAHPWRRRQV
eukprot:SAG31_NODE_11378_length_1037_cov_1.164179_1_plen_187_part_00